MTRLFASRLVFLALLSGCATPGQPDPLAGQKAALQFCNAYVGAMQTMIAYRQAGALTPGQIDAVSRMAAVVGPQCSMPAPPPPSEALIGLLNGVVAIQLEIAARKAAEDAAADAARRNALQGNSVGAGEVPPAPAPTPSTGGST